MAPGVDILGGRWELTLAITCCFGDLGGVGGKEKDGGRGGGEKKRGSQGLS